MTREIINRARKEQSLQRARVFLREAMKSLPIQSHPDFIVICRDLEAIEEDLELLAKVLAGAQK